MSTNRGRWPVGSAGRGHGSSLLFRGRGRGFNQHSSQPPRQTAARPPSPPLGPVLKTLGEDELAESPSLGASTPGIIDCEDIVSYNWLHGSEPTIVIPGLHALPSLSCNTLNDDV